MAGPLPLLRLPELVAASEGFLNSIFPQSFGLVPPLWHVASSRLSKCLRFVRDLSPPLGPVGGY